ncbi:MAG TPA: cytidylate kinase, partial [Porticoccaceae bacterium]|nr:cytidylate kinase [Porticoccaceae bacterium]
EESDSLPALIEKVKARDERDRKREVSPLRPAEDAIVIDTTGLTVQAVLAKVRQHVDLRLGH